MADLPKLPLELIFHIISSLLGDHRTILKPSHSTTKTLLSFTLVCRATYPVASNYLREHCVYIDDDLRLRHLIHHAESTRAHNTTTTATTTTNAHHNHHLSLTASPNPRPPLHPLTALYLAPFQRHTIDDQPTAIWLRELFCLLAPTLRRLVIDIPLRSLRPADDHLAVRDTLRDAFAMLTALEEFVSVRDELYLDVSEPEWRVPAAGLGAGAGAGVGVGVGVGVLGGSNVEAPAWTAWPKLRRLALYNRAADEGFWRAVAGAAALETLVLTRADCLDGTCMKSEYLGCWSSGGGGAGLGAVGAVGETLPLPLPPRPLKVVLVNVSNEQQPGSWAGRWKWDRVDPENVMKVMTYDVPTSFYGDDDGTSLCQDWVKTAALRGDLWDWEGPLVTGAPRANGPTGAVVFELEA